MLNERASFIDIKNQLKTTHIHSNVAIHTTKFNFVIIIIGHRLVGRSVFIIFLLHCDCTYHFNPDTHRLHWTERELRCFGNDIFELSAM